MQVRQGGCCLGRWETLSYVKKRSAPPVLPTPYQVRPLNGVCRGAMHDDGRMNSRPVETGRRDLRGGVSISIGSLVILKG